MSILRGSVSDIDQTLAMHGWRKAGDMWGSAYWYLTHDRTLLFSLSKAGGSINDIVPPTSVSESCIVMVHDGPFEQEWLDEWDMDDGILGPPAMDKLPSAHLFPQSGNSD